MNATAIRLCNEYLASQGASDDCKRFDHCLAFWKRACQRAQIYFSTESPSDDMIRRVWPTVR